MVVCIELKIKFKLIFSFSKDQWFNLTNGNVQNLFILGALYHQH